MEPLRQQLEILHSIVNQEETWGQAGAGYRFSTAAEFCRSFEISDRTFKRHIAELKALGADLYSEKSIGNLNGAYVWRCRNWRELVRTGTYYRWLDAERERAMGVKLDEV